MKPFSLIENIILSYKTYFYLMFKTFSSGKDSQARLTIRRFFTMICFGTLFFILKSFNWLGFIFDDIFFRSYKNVEIKEPLFIVGVPRSGTTFLHRFLSKDKDRYTTISLWELVLAPSITQRKIILGVGKIDSLIGSPMFKFIKWAEKKAFSGLDSIHEISLSDPEEDYFFLAPIYACFIMILPFPFYEDLGHLASFDDDTPEKERERIMAFYKTCLQRHLFVRGDDKILLSKNVSFSPMIEALSKTFPDSKIIGTVRNPAMAVPSHISSMMEGVEIFDNNTFGDEFRDQMIEVQRYAYSHLKDKLPLLGKKRQLIVTMEELKRDLYNLVKSIYHVFEYNNISDEFLSHLLEHSEKQKAYKSSHKYDLSDFGLTEEDIYHQFFDVYEDYGYQPPGMEEPEIKAAGIN